MPIVCSMVSGSRRLALSASSAFTQSIVSAIRQGDFALTLVASTLSIQQGKISTASVAYAGVGAHAIRVPEVEQILIGQAPSDALFVKAAELAANQIEPGSDAHADTEYRRDLIRTLTPRALQNAATTA